MKMTIDDAIKWIEEHHSLDLKCKDDEAHRIAIDIMRKYCRIQEIVREHDVDNMPEDYWYIDKIREVLEDGKETRFS